MGNASLSSQIRVQYIRFLVIYSFLGLLVAWQWHFVIEGFSHNVYLNGAIFGTFFFGSALAFRDLRNMTNERLAFEALQEAYTDIQRGKARSKEDPFWRHYRCLEKGEVFTHPQLLGHLFDIIVEELHRTKHMQITVGTMQTLIGALEHANAQSRSLLQYMSGLLVFLGLIGTFIGLMEMVGSVGGIIGGLANAESGSGDAMKQLLKDLQAPMTGMATGFGASLFGLFTSLVLGLVNRFVGSAGHAIKAEFEAWLAGIAQIENDKKAGNGNGASGNGANGEGGEGANGLPQDATFMASPGVAAIITAMRSTNHTFEKTADAVMKLAERRKEENDALMATCAQMERLTAEQDSMRRAIAALGGIRDDVNSLRQLDYAQANRMIDGFNKIEVTMEEIRMSSQRGFEDMAMRELETLRQARTNTEQIIKKLDEGTYQAAERQHETVDRLETLAQMQASLTRLLQSSQGQTNAKIDDLAGSLSDIHSIHAEITKDMANLRGELSGGIRELTNRPDTSPQIQQMSVSMDSALIKGLGEIAQVLNTALGVMTASMKEIATKQNETTNVIGAMSETRELTTEIRSLGRSIDSGLSQGFAEMSRSFESIFLSYSELLARVNTGAPAPAAATAPVPQASTDLVPVAPEAASDDAAAKEKAMADMNAHQRLEHMEKLYSSAKGRLGDLLKSA
ncbi:MAG: hypothetical protein LCH61_03365 [Proteobacteria bacterium]|nr:hypothetical protein [Pseudomonadota bacterium]